LNNSGFFNMRELAPVLRAAVEVQRFCRRQRWRFCIIGGLAVQRWGQPRVTTDVDLTLLTGFGDEDAFITKLLAQFKPRRRDAADFALRSRVLLLETARGTAIDVALGGLPFEQRCVKRATSHNFDRGCRLVTCSAEDLLVHKCFAGREIDWFDVEGIAARQRGKLDLKLIRRELAPLLELKGAPEAMARFDELIRRRS
jgi:hypothetical protein